MTDTINNQIPFVPENTIDPAAGLNLSLNTIDALLQVLVQSVGENTPPAGVEGQRFIVGTAPTGAWAGQSNKLARFLDGAWQFFDARHVLNAADGLWYVRSASTWSPLAGGGGGSGTVTSVGFTAPTGFDVAGSPVTTDGTLALSFAAGYSLPTDTAQGDWSTAFSWGDHASAGYEKQLTAGANITIDRTDPDNPIISSTAAGGGGGDVVGPASAVNNGVALFDGITGKLLKDGGVLGSAAFTASTAYATAAQGTLADTALQPGDVGASVQGWSANLDSWSAIAPSAKQNTLVSATNIKTINGASILGPGNLIVGGLTNPMTAAGDIIVGGTSGVPARLAKGTDGQVLLMTSGVQGYGNNPILAGYSEIMETMAGTAIDVGASNVKKKVLSANTTFTITGATSGRASSFTLLLEAGATYTVTWPASFKWIGSVPTLTAKDVITGFSIDGGTQWLVSYAGSYV